MRLFVAVAIVCLALVACDPVPRRTLTTEEKIADLYWIFSQFNENYAPLEYKQKRFGFDYEALKKKYLLEVESTKTNEEFYSLMYRFVSEFKDAHTSASLTNPDSPNRVKVAYLGFSGNRKGNTLVVTELLPTIQTSVSKYPIKVGDIIAKLDGAALPELVQKDMAHFRDLGQSESNLTLHMNRIFNRVSTANGLPSKDMAVLTLLVPEKSSKKDEDEKKDKDKEKEKVKYVEKEVTLPWVIKDLYDFNREQKAAKKEDKKTTSQFFSSTIFDTLTFDDGEGEVLFRLGLVDFNGRVFQPSTVMDMITKGSANFKIWDTFRFTDVAGWTARISDGDVPKSGIEELKKARNIPKSAVMISAAKVYPAYVVREKVKDAEGKDKKETKLVGYVWLDTFSPSESQDNTLKEFKATLQAFAELGVEHLVIDLINNGGGSLMLGMGLAQLLSPQKLLMPEIEFRISETWVDQFESTMRSAPSDTEREIARRVFSDMLGDKSTGKRMSRRYSAETLGPYSIQPDIDLTARFKIALLVNEMCASMCDIFTAILKDNGLATVVGSKTMGAGGNVVNHQQAPNSHLDLRQTESLILRKDGSYIENNGIDPDIAMDVTDSVESKYDDVREKAIEVLLKEAQ